jgi:hypothetical protein
MSQRSQSPSRAQKSALPTRGWARITSAAEYADVDPRTVREWLRMGLKHARMNQKTILIQYDDIDDFLKSFIVNPAEDQTDLARLADDVMRDLKQPPAKRLKERSSHGHQCT